MLSGVCRRSSTKGLKKNYKRFTIFFAKTLAKWFQKSYNMVTESGKTLLSEIFFFLLSVDIGCAAPPPPAVLLRSCWPRTAQAVSSLRVQKSSLPFGGGLFCAPGLQQGRTARIFGNKVLLSAVLLDKVSGFRKDSFGKFVLRNACVCAGLCYNRCKHF